MLHYADPTRLLIRCGSRSYMHFSGSRTRPASPDVRGVMQRYIIIHERYVFVRQRSLLPNKAAPAVASVTSDRQHYSMFAPPARRDHTRTAAEYVRAIVNHTHGPRLASLGRPFQQSRAGRRGRRASHPWPHVVPRAAVPLGTLAALHTYARATKAPVSTPLRRYNFER